MEILYAVGILSGLGVLAGALLAYASKVFYVKEDPRVEEVDSILPQANCGACGYAGCRDFAKAIVSGEDIVCPVGGPSVAELVAQILGKEAAEVEERVAFVKCAGTHDRAKKRATYHGVKTCAAAHLVGGDKECRYGCLGLGDCAAVCPTDAITISRGVAVIDPEKCIGCELCVQACPVNVIEMVPKSRKMHVVCNSQDPPQVARKVCDVACIACKICTRTDKNFTMEGNVAVFTGSEGGLDTAPFVCPTNAIMDESKYRALEFVLSDAVREAFEQDKAAYKERERAERAKRAAARKAAQQKKAAAQAGGEAKPATDKSAAKPSEDGDKKDDSKKSNESNKIDSSPADGDKKAKKEDKAPKAEDTGKEGE